jgi:hypothetical protein
MIWPVLSPPPATHRKPASAVATTIGGHVANLWRPAKFAPITMTVSRANDDPPSVINAYSTCQDRQLLPECLEVLAMRVPVVNADGHHGNSRFNRGGPAATSGRMPDRGGTALRRSERASADSFQVESSRTFEEVMSSGPLPKPSV